MSEKCCVCSAMTDCSVIYRKYPICVICRSEWGKAYAVLSKGKYHHIGGWRKWLPIFEGWKKEQKRKIVSEKVVFT